MRARLAALALMLLASPALAQVPTPSIGLNLQDGSGLGLSTSNRAVLRYNNSTHSLEASINGAAYGPVGGATGNWTFNGNNADLNNAGPINIAAFGGATATSGNIGGGGGTSPRFGWSPTIAWMYSQNWGDGIDVGENRQYAVNLFGTSTDTTSSVGFLFSSYAATAKIASFRQPFATERLYIDASGYLVHSVADAIGTAQTAGVSYANTTAAANNAQQYSPMAPVLEGRGWDSSGSTSKATKWGIQTRPIQTAGDPASDLVFWRSTNGGAYTERARFSTTLGLVLTAADSTTTNLYSSSSTAAWTQGGYGLLITGGSTKIEPYSDHSSSDNVISFGSSTVRIATVYAANIDGGSGGNVNINAPGLVINFKANGTIKMALANSGGNWQPGIDLDVALGSTSFRWSAIWAPSHFNSVADGAAAVGFTFNNTATLSTNGAKLFSFQNNGTENFAFKYNSGTNFTLSVGPNTSGSTVGILFGGNGTSLSDGAGAFLINSTTSARLSYNSATNEVKVDNNGVTMIGYVRPGSTTFGSLGTPSNGFMIYCSDCTIANPCAGAGNGAFAKRLNGVWVCN